jgi:hypothetical protein
MYIHVKVHAGAKKERFEALDESHFRVAVKEPAEQNRANRRVVSLLATRFGVPDNRVRLISGHHSPSKIFDIAA